MTSDEQIRKLHRRLVTTQVVGGLIMIGLAGAVVAFRPENKPEVSVGETRVTHDGFRVEQNTLGRSGLQLLSGDPPRASVLVHADQAGAFVAAGSEKHGLTMAVSADTPVVRLVATGRIRTELRFDTESGAIAVVRNTDRLGGAATEQLVNLVPGLGQ
jgi:hypothetical protein